MNIAAITRSTAKVALVVLAVLPLAGFNAAASAATLAGDGGYRTASMQCSNITGDVSLFVPFQPVEPTFTVFAVSVDSGAWQVSNWFWSSTSFRHFEYANGWQLSSGQVMSTLPSGPHTVTGWAWQVAGGRGNWVYLGTCDATNMF